MISLDSRTLSWAYETNHGLSKKVPLKEAKEMLEDFYNAGKGANNKAPSMNLIGIKIVEGESVHLGFTDYGTATYEFVFRLK